MKIVIKQFSKPTHWEENKAWINLRKEFVEQAKKAKTYIVVKLPQGYCKPVDPAKLLKYGKKTEAVFLYPENPMKLIGAYFELYPQETQAWIDSDPYFWDNL